jgi:glycosyltransferase involved in cell wall biosynthesis
MNILHTCFSGSWGGLEIHSLLEAAQISRLGHDVWLSCLKGSRLESEARSQGIQVLPVRAPGYFHPMIVLRIRQFLLRNHIEIIHCQHSRDLATVVPAAKLSGRAIPVILSKRVGSFVLKNDLFHRYTYSGVSRVLAISEVIRRNVVETTPMSPDRVVTLHYGVDPEDYSLKKADRERVRREFGFRQEDVVIGFVGRFSPGKGLEEFLDAASKIKRTGLRSRFLVVGEGTVGEEDYARWIRARAFEFGLDDVLTFAGFRSDVRDVMAALDILAFPSHAESFGAVLVEAMAVERPVVSTNCDGVLDIVVNGETGLYVNPRNADELAGALSMLVIDAGLRERLGKAGRVRVEAMFDQRNLLKRLEGIYKEVIEEARGPNYPRH